MTGPTKFLWTWKLRTLFVLLVAIIPTMTVAENDEQQTCSADGVCGPEAGGDGQHPSQKSQQQQPFQQQQQQLNQQQQQQQKQDSPHYIVEIINIEFGEPQVVLNHATDITRLNIQHTQQYISMYPSWKSTCLNRHQLCSFWAANGECTVNEWMTDNCAPSCQLCPLPDNGPRPRDQQQKDGDTNQSDDNNNTNNNNNNSTEWDNFISVAIPCGEPQVVPTVNADPVVQTIANMLSYMHQKVYVEEKYAKVREECRCKDHRCAAWASQGECDKNPSYMKMACAPACGTCEQISYEFRCPYDKNAPTALNPGDLDTKFERILNDFTQYSPTILSSPNNTSKGPWVIQLDTFATEEECERLIQLGAEVGYGDSRTVGKTYADGTVESVVENRIRTSKNAWCEDTCESDPIVIPLLDRIENLLEIPKNNSEFLQLLRYQETQFYGQHHDYLDHHKDRPQGVRILTLFLYLNDVEEGGETKFPHIDAVVKPKRGRAVLWPSVLNELPDVKDFRTEHEALAVIKGVKYGANAWVHQRDYREPHYRSCT